MVKRKQKKSSTSNNQTHIKSKFRSITPISSATLTSNLGAITTSPTGILGNDVNLQSLSDIFRLMRINSITFNFAPATGTSSAAVEIPSGFLGYTPYGISVNPTSYADFETPLVSENTVPFGTTTTTTAPLTKETSTVLHLVNRMMPILDGAANGWLATQNDGFQTNYGNLWWNFMKTTAANTIDYVLTTYFDVSFKDLLDPASISKLFEIHPAGLPHYIEATPGSELHSAHLFYQGRWQKNVNPAPSRPLALAPPVRTESENDQDDPSTEEVFKTLQGLDPSTLRVLLRAASNLGNNRGPPVPSAL